MDWFLSIMRVAGASFPVASSFVQLQSEIDSKSISERVSKLEDPISCLHDYIPEVSLQIYEKLKLDNFYSLKFDKEFYTKYSRPLAVLESQGYIEGGHTIGNRYYDGIRLIDPTFIMYLCALSEDTSKMSSLIKIVDECGIGKWLNGIEIEGNFGLPLPVISAVFSIYESKGYGARSREVRSCSYVGKA